MSYKKLGHLLTDLIQTCNEHDVTLILSGTTHVDGDSDPLAIPWEKPRDGGFFSHEPHPMLVVATKRKLASWVGILIHESCHMDQWLAGSPYWDTSDDNGECLTAMLFEWIDHERELDDETLAKAIQVTRDVELDCERRALEKIKKYDLTRIVGVREYIKRANAYILFYNHIAKHRTWYNPKKQPYEMQNVWSKFPSKWLDDYTVLDSKYEKLYKSIAMRNNKKKKKNKK